LKFLFIIFDHIINNIVKKLYVNKESNRQKEYYDELFDDFFILCISLSCSFNFFFWSVGPQGALNPDDDPILS
jgi:hypothetical protein